MNLSGPCLMPQPVLSCPHLWGLKGNHSGSRPYARGNRGQVLQPILAPRREPPCPLSLSSVESSASPPSLLPSQSRVLAALVAAAIRAERPNLATIGRQLAGPTTAKSAIKPVWRFTDNARVEVADATAGRERMRFEDVVGEARAVTALADGRQVLATGRAREIVLLDLEAGAVRARLAGHEPGVRDLALAMS